MELLPKIRDGAIVTEEKVKIIRRGGLRRNKQNPRQLGTNPRAKAKALWKEYFQQTEFIKHL